MHITDAGDVSFLLSLLTILNMELLSSLSCSPQALMSCYQCLFLITCRQGIIMSFLSSCDYSHTHSSLLYHSKHVFLSKILIIRWIQRTFKIFDNQQEKGAKSGETSVSSLLVHTWVVFELPHLSVTSSTG